MTRPSGGKDKKLSSMVVSANSSPSADSRFWMSTCSCDLGSMTVAPASDAINDKMAIATAMYRKSIKGCGSRFPTLSTRFSTFPGNFFVYCLMTLVICKTFMSVSLGGPKGSMLGWGQEAVFRGRSSSGLDVAAIPFGNFGFRDQPQLFIGSDADTKPARRYVQNSIHGPRLSVVWITLGDES